MNCENFDSIVEKSLKIEPTFNLPADFASKVTLHIVRREQWKIDLREYLLYSGLVIGLITLVGGFYYFVDQNFMLNVFSYLKENWLSVATVAVLVNFIFFTDKVLLRVFFNRWNVREESVQ